MRDKPYFSQFIMRVCWVFLVIVIAADGADGQNRSRNNENLQPFLVLGHGAGVEQIILIDGWAPDWKIFQRRGQITLTPLSAGLQLTRGLQVFGTLQYHSFEYVVDVANYRSREDNLMRPEPIVLGILISEHERNKRQEVFLPTFGVELSTKIIGKLYLNAGVEAGKFKHQSDYFYEGAWGYNKDEDGTFDQIEINTLSAPKEPSKTRKVNVYLTPEWRKGLWRAGVSIGLQYKSFRGREFTGTSQIADYSRWTGFPHGIYAVNDAALGITYGLRINYVVLSRR